MSKALLPAVLVALLGLIVGARPLSAQSSQAEPPFGVAPAPLMEPPMTEPPAAVSTRVARPRTAGTTTKARTTKTRTTKARTNRTRPVRTADRPRSSERRQSHVARSPPPNQLAIAENNGFKRLSDLVNFPKFFPGLGVVFVKPDTIPLGPFLCFDRNDRLIATVYMVSTKDIDDHKSFEAPAFAGSVDHVSYYFNAGHPGFEMPHYHIVIWHVSKEEETHAAH